MKNVTTPAVREEAEYYCDSCGVEAFIEVKMNAWYGSKFDMSQTTIHLCDDCWVRIKDTLKSGFGIDGKTESITEL